MYSLSSICHLTYLIIEDDDVKLRISVINNFSTISMAHLGYCIINIYKFLKYAFKRIGYHVY